MPEDNSTTPRPDVRSPWVIDTRTLGRRPGSSREVRRDVPVETELGVPGVISVPKGENVELDLLLESVVEGVLVTGSAFAPTAGQCSRCLDPLSDEVELDLTELFAYPDSSTEETTEEDEVSRLVDDLVDLEPIVRDALVLALPQVPLCSDDCAGLCSVCGVKWADLEPNHGHETIDPRWAALVERFDESPAGGPEEKA
ncbi:metal-binding protein [Amycolatopsis antarctica]|uniref:Metal-binding protein n=1 Tax=Amycolatopsis antarctica TaxID=1854586 RepID=A0A263D755_9PSEU|nr:YceD family protein [Amycolatopsis antarctica]OZM74211.1 metal-binding protein [Amycolatopsis antarctica]